MSKLLKERIIYITSIALGLLIVIALCFNFMNVTESYVEATETKFRELALNGFQIMFGIDAIKGSEAEGMLQTFMFIVAIISLASIAFAGFALRGSFKHPDKSYTKKWYIIFQIALVALSYTMMLWLITYITRLNTETDPAHGGWSIFIFKAKCGNVSSFGPCIFIILALSAISLGITCVLTAMVKDNSLVLPYKKREIISSVLTIVACAAAFFVSLCDFYYTTDYINQNAASIFTTSQENGGDYSLFYSLYGGYELFTIGGGGMAGYLKVLLYIMQISAIMGIVYNVFFLLAAVGVFRINFDRKINNKINLVLMVIGILMCVGCCAYCYGVNFKLSENWNTYVSEFPGIKELWNTNMWADASGNMIGFPKSQPHAGAYVVLYPIVTYLSTRFINEYPD